MVKVRHSKSDKRPRRRVLVYIHYNRHNELSEYVLYQLEKMRCFYEKVIVLSNSKLTAFSRNKLRKYADKVVQRNNTGFDFAAWRDGIHSVGWDNLLDSYDELTLMNDTCFGPIRDMTPVYERFSDNDAVDFWGITNHRAEAYGMPGTMSERNPLGNPIPEYIQTYFITFKNNVAQSEAFRSFWDNVEDKSDIKQMIIHYETKLTKLLNDAGFKSAVLVETKRIQMPAHAPFHNACLWTPDILLPLSPFIKRKAFVRNSRAAPLVLSRFEKINYPISYIVDYVRSIGTRETADGSEKPKLVVLRGNSGSGKTTVARKLKKELFYKAMIIGWDTLRIDIFNRFDYVNREKYIFDTLHLLCEYGRKNNFVVILDGIYPAKQYRKILLDIANNFAQSHFYYFDVSLEESARRHETREKRLEFGLKELQKWYISCDTLGVIGEKVIDDTMEENEIVGMILGDLGRGPEDRE